MLNKLNHKLQSHARVVLAKLCLDLLSSHMARPIFHTGRYSFMALILKAIASCTEDHSDLVRL